MILQLVIEQGLNGLQFGVTLFLMAAGLTLVFGVMDVIHLSHGSFYMMGAFLTASLGSRFDSYLIGLALAIPAVALIGMAVEWIAIRRLYQRQHLDQVLATFGLIMIFNELVRMVWGSQPIFLSPPAALAGTVEVLPGIPYPLFRLAILAAGLAVAVLLAVMIRRTRLGMRLRAGASDRAMAGALGVDIDRLFTIVFGLGAGLAALAGGMAGTVLSVQVGMGESILILAFVVVVIGGIGSIKGALVGAILVGLVDTLARTALPVALRSAMAASQADSVAASLSSTSVYLLMVLVLAWRPKGLYGART
ncbi:branched-chain amino acid ABC transporter permease [Magnetospirillum sp. UT-4]|uniref:branched-chain amino acid ABC transporter permease n=1 Tax=Magnetospirillum sp. UT-4 TaxID=2681467 RepID=UPI00137F1C14|nr:branched-chain amino acid ABC transporter permease [Magnetospirillum sp. UT-4]CAA7627031.1 putative High-affinity branched-chain amino acid transport system permease protein livH [Magnetospirillum sp. UT-4]